MILHIYVCLHMSVKENERQTQTDKQTERESVSGPE